MNQLTRVFFVVSPRLFFQFLLDPFLNFREPFAAKFEAAESFIHARSRLKFLQPSTVEDFVNCWSTDAVSLRELSGFEVLLRVILPNLFTLDWGESGVFMEMHVYRSMD